MTPIRLDPIKKASKFRNVKTVLDGITFDSKREAARWGELRMLERVGQISNLRRQVAYELAPSVKFAGAERAKPAIKYWVDFEYIEKGATVCEDSKGALTDVFRIKQHLMKSVHGIDVRLTK